MATFRYKLAVKPEYTFKIGDFDDRIIKITLIHSDRITFDAPHVSLFDIRCASHSTCDARQITKTERDAHAGTRNLILFSLYRL